MKFCKQCGRQLSDEMRFCPACGQVAQPHPIEPQTPAAPQPDKPQTPAAPQPDRPQAPAEKASAGPGRVLFLLLGVVAAGAVIAVLLAIGVLRPGFEAKRTVEGPGYASPEEAARAYAEALKAGDIEAMLSTFAIESYVEHFDTAAYLEYLRGIVFSDNTVRTLLAEDDFALAINTERRRAYIVQGIYYQYLNRLLADADTDYYNAGHASFPKSEEGDKEIDELLRLLRQTPGFSDMTIGAAHSAEDLLRTDALEAYQVNVDRRLEWCGARDMRDVCLEVTIDREDYYLFVSTVRYDGRWYNFSWTSTLGGILGPRTRRYEQLMLIPVDEIEY